MYVKGCETDVPKATTTLLKYKLEFYDDKHFRLSGDLICTLKDVIFMEGSLRPDGRFEVQGDLISPWNNDLA